MTGGSMEQEMQGDELSKALCSQKQLSPALSAPLRII
jgi:hypothetical protein